MSDVRIERQTIKNPLFDVRCRNCDGGSVLLGVRITERGSTHFDEPFLRCLTCGAEQGSPGDVDGT